MNNVQLWNKLFSKDHLKEHFEEKVKSKPSVGLDHITMLKFQNEIDSEIAIIEKKVKAGTYTFTRYKQVLFSKGPHKAPRIVSIPTIRDKLVASVLNELLCTIFDNQAKSPLPQVIISDIASAIDCYDTYIKIDISNFYSSINHETLMRIIRRKIRKKEILSLIENAIKTETISVPIKIKQKRNISKIGIPEGLPISNALANIYMSDIDDKYKKYPNVKYYRYVDDILLLAGSTEVDQIKKSISIDLKRLKLTRNAEKEEKNVVQKYFSYLGYSISVSSITVKKSSIYRLESSIEELIKMCKYKSRDYLEWKLNLKVTGFILDNNKYGWVFFYSQINDTSILHHLDWFIDKLLVRYNLQSEIKQKKFVRTYYEIIKGLHETRYIPNINEFTIERKKVLLTKIYGQEINNYSDSEIEYSFRKIMRKEIQDIEKDVEHIS